MYDIVLIAVAAFLNLALTFTGLYVAVRPVEQEKRKRRVLRILFAGCVVALAIAVWVAWRGTEAQTSLQKTAEHTQKTAEHTDTGVEKVLGIVTNVQKSVASLPQGSSGPAVSKTSKTNSGIVSAPRLLNGFLQFAQFQYIEQDEFFTLGKPLQLNVYYINKGQAPVQNAHITAALTVAVRGNNSQRAVDGAVLQTVEPLIREKTDEGVTIGVDTYLWTTPSLPDALTQEMVDGIMKGQMVLYSVSYARWIDSYGKQRDVLDCVWLNPPQNEHPALHFLVWQHCSR